MNKQAMQQTHTSVKRAWALPLLLASLSACVGPVKEGDVDWQEFDSLLEGGLSEIEQIDGQVDALEAELFKLSEHEILDENYLSEGVAAGEGDVAQRWHRMKEVKNNLEELRHRRSVATTNKKGLAIAREAKVVEIEADASEFLVDAWKRTRKGAKNVHLNLGFGALTDNVVQISGLITTPVPGVTLPFSGVLGGDSMKTDSSDIGMELYIRDNLAVEAGLIFSNAVRDEESVDYGVLSYDDELHVGSFVGVKYCFEPVNSSGGGGINGRTRFFVNARLGLMEEYDFSGEVSFGPGTTPVDLGSSGDAYFTLGLGAGVLYAWTDHIALELGVNLVTSISDMEGQWSFSGPDGDGDSYSGDYETDLSMTRGYIGLLFGF